MSASVDQKADEQHSYKTNINTERTTVPGTLLLTDVLDEKVQHSLVTSADIVREFVPFEQISNGSVSGS